MLQYNILFLMYFTKSYKNIKKYIIIIVNILLRILQKHNKYIILYLFLYMYVNI